MNTAEEIELKPTWPEQTGPVSHRFLAGFVLLVVTGCLFAFRDAKPYTGTLVVGIVGMIAVTGCVLFKYNYRIHFNAETILIAGIVLQFLFAPTIHRIITDDFNVSGMSSDRRILKDNYAGAMLLVLVYVSVYMMVSAFMPQRAVPRDANGRAVMLFTTRSFVIFAFVAVQLWVARSILLATGSYYAIHRSRFQFDDSGYSALAQADIGFGTALLAFLIIATIYRKVNWVITLAYIVVEIGWNFLSGSRGKTIMTVGVIFLTYLIYRKRFSLIIIVALLASGLFLAAFMDHYRYALRTATTVNNINLSNLAYALSVAGDRSQSEGSSGTFQRTIARLNDLESIAAIYTWVPSEVNYLNGETYFGIPASLVPRVFWPEKPMVIRPISEWFFRREGGSSPITSIGEGYFNYGLIGVVIAGILSAVLIQFTERVLTNRIWNLAVFPFYILFLSQGVLTMHSSAMAIWVSTYVKVIVFTMIVHLLTAPRALTAEPLGFPVEPFKPADDEAGALATVS